MFEKCFNFCFLNYFYDLCIEFLLLLKRIIGCVCMGELRYYILWWLIKERGRVNGSVCWFYGLFKRVFIRKRKSFDVFSINDLLNKLRIMNYFFYYYLEL